MKIKILCDSKKRLGGGYRFMENFQSGVEIVESDEDVCLIPSSSVILPETLNKHKDKPLAMRVDGYPEDWRNSGRGISRLLSYSKKVDLLIYQSQFSYEFVGRFLEQNGVNTPKTLIYNGVDLDIFKPEGEIIEKNASHIIVVNFLRKDPNKRYEEVMYKFRKLWLDNKDISLWIIGNIPTKYKEYNWGFFNNERVKKFGIIASRKRISKILRSADEMWYPSFADPCPNALLEGLACGLPVSDTAEFGGVSEILKLHKKHGIKFFSLEKMVKNYTQALRKL